MRELLDSTLTIILAVLAGIVVGWLLASEYWLDSISADCRDLGKYRYLGNAYQCSPLNGLPPHSEG